MRGNSPGARTAVVRGSVASSIEGGNMPNDPDAERRLYETLDMITDALERAPRPNAHTHHAEDIMQDLLMNILGLVPENGNYVTDPERRDASTRVMRRWLKDHGFLPRHPLPRPRHG
jgi:hypothetical protein